MGNIPAAVVNNMPIPLIARTLDAYGHAASDAANNAYNWATTSEGEALKQTAAKAAGAAAPAPPPAQVTPSGTPTQAGTPQDAASYIAGPESGGNPNAKSTRSSATGTGQFIKSTWAEFMHEMHPELGSAGEDIQKYRTNDALSREAINWYAGKNTAVLQAHGYPVDHANIYLAHHFGPTGAVNLLDADPSVPAVTVLDNDAVAANPWVRDLSVAQLRARISRMAGQPTPALPYQQKSYQATSPPDVPGYVDQPIAQPPDYSESNSWWEQAAPQRYTTPAEQKNDRIGAILQGMAQGAANTDLTRSGAVGKLFANVGAGALAGRAGARADERAAEQDYGRRQQGYAASRAGVAGQRAETKATYGNAAAETKRANVVGKQGTDYNQATQDYTVSEANKATKFKADQANAEALTQWNNSIGVPQILGTPSDKGFWTNTPGTGIEFHPAPAQESDLFKNFGKPKLPDEINDRVTYNMIAQTGREPLKSRVLKDIVKSGQAPRVMPPELVAEATALADADKSLQMLMGTTGYSAARDEIISNYLEEKLRGNDGWVPSAAAIGNYGAQILMDAQ